MIAFLDLHRIAERARRARDDGDFLHGGAVRLKRCDKRVSDFVIGDRALLLVGEQVIGAGDGGEELRRIGFVLIAIGVQFLGELAIRLLDLVFARPARHAKQLVRIGHLWKFRSRFALHCI